MNEDCRIYWVILIYFFIFSNDNGTNAVNYWNTNDYNSQRNCSSEKICSRGINSGQQNFREAKSPCGEYSARLNFHQAKIPLVEISTGRSKLAVVRFFTAKLPVAKLHVAKLLAARLLVAKLPVAKLRIRNYR